MMQSLLLLLFLPFLCVESAQGALEGSFRTRRRSVMAWANSDAAAVAQLQNASWTGIFDGVQAFCGATFRSDGSGLEINHTKWEECSPLLAAAQEQGIKFYLCIAGKVPDQAMDPQPVIDEAVAFATKYGLDGFSLDDEYDCAPRSTLHRLERWMAYVNALADGLHDTGLELSAAVQAMFGIQDAPYNPYCKPDASPADCSQACKDPPSSYPFEPRVTKLLTDSPMDRWLEMDTYYFSTGRFLNALDWHVEHVPQNKLGVGMMNRDDLTEDGLLARFHAMDKSGVDWINVFMLPVDDFFLPYLQRWKSFCAGCGAQSVLGCYELAVPCNKSDAVEML